MIPRPPKTTRTYTRFPDTTLFRSIRWHLLRAKCEDALALVSSVRDGILPIADVFGQGHCEEGFGRALDEEDHRSVRSAAERRHEAVRGIEWNLVEPLPFRALQFRIDRRLHRQGKQRTFHGIAFDAPFRSEEHTSELQSPMRTS